MATWQRDYFFVPVLKLREVYGSVPMTISKDDFYGHSWWEGMAAFDEETIENILPRFVDREGKTLKGWWGTDAGNRISIVYGDDDKSTVEVFLRIDMTEETPKILSFVQEVADLAKRNKCFLLSTSGQVRLPESAAILKDLNLSSV